MPDITVAEKTCTRCGETKPLSEFYRNKNSRDGRKSQCGECVKQQVQEYQEAKRREMGEEAWREKGAERVRRHRAAGRDSVSRLGNKAYRQALFGLRDRHPDEFAALLRQNRYDLGLEMD